MANIDKQELEYLAESIENFRLNWHTAKKMSISDNPAQGLIQSMYDANMACLSSIYSILSNME